MRVKIKNKIYDAAEEPILIILDENDKYNISHMKEGDQKYCCYPQKMKEDEVETFMKEDYL